MRRRAWLLWQYQREAERLHQLTAKPLPPPKPGDSRIPVIRAQREAERQYQAAQQQAKAAGGSK